MVPGGGIDICTHFPANATQGIDKNCFYCFALFSMNNYGTRFVGQNVGLTT